MFLEEIHKKNIYVSLEAVNSLFDPMCFLQMTFHKKSVIDLHNNTTGEVVENRM